MNSPISKPLPTTIAGLRILGFCDWYSPSASGGAERAAWEIYRRLGAAGARIHVVSAAHGPPHRDEGVVVEPIRSVDLSRFAGGYIAPAPGAFAAAKRALDGHRPDVVHVTTIHYTGCIAGAWIAERRGLPLVVTAQLGALDHLPPRNRRVADRYERVVGGYILRRATGVLAVSQAAADHAVSLGARPDVVSVAPNGADHDRFRLTASVPKPRPLVVAVGRLTMNKGPDLVVEACGALAAAGVGFDLAFVGDGPMRRQLAERGQRLGLDGRIEFAGHVSDVERWLERADIVVRASYTEGLALGVLEAMAVGRCNVVSDIPANLELIRDHENGLTFTAGDSRDLARALRAAIADAGLRDRLGRRAHEDSLPFTWDNMARRHAETMLACAGRGSAHT